MSTVNLGKDPIIFGSSDCPACLAQFKMINDHYNSMGQSRYMNYYDLNQYDAPFFIMSRSGNVSMPTIYAPVKGKNYGKIRAGVVSDPKKFDKITSNKIWTKTAIKNVEKLMNFGQTAKLIATPPVGNLKKYGKTFPNGKGLQVKKSWANVISDRWGKDITNSGTLGREFGPNGTDRIYSGGYFNNIRMARPGGDLDTALRTNYLAFINRPPKNTNTSQNVAGLVYDRKVPDFVGFNGLPGLPGKPGKERKTSFGRTGLYHQMGAPFGRNGVEYLLNANTVADFYGGATNTFSLSNNKRNLMTKIPKRPKKVQDNSIYISKGKTYSPLKPDLMKLGNYQAIKNLF